MAHLKRIQPGAIDGALEKAKHYRLLNEPWHAESICLDVLETDRDNQPALVMLLLSLSDQFASRHFDAFQHAESLIDRLTDPYEQPYYTGIVYERWGIALMNNRSSEKGAAEWLGKAMKCYESAEQLAADGNPDPLLRWNTCARLRERLETHLAPAPLTRDIHGEYGDDVPTR